MSVGLNQGFFFGGPDTMSAEAYRWCDPSPSYHRGAAVCTLNTFVYTIWRNPPALVVQMPVPEEDVVFSYSVLTSPAYGGVEADDVGHAPPVQRPILDAYPQPFNPEIRLRFVVPTDGPVTIRIYDVLGREIRTLVDEEDMSSGIYFYTWDGRDKHHLGVGTGVYFCRLTVGGQSAVRKLVMIR